MTAALVTENFGLGVKVACSASFRIEKCDDLERNLKMSLNVIHVIHMLMSNRLYTYILMSIVVRIKHQRKVIMFISPKGIIFLILLNDLVLWSPYVIGQTIIFLPCDFYLLSSSTFFIPRLISAVADWMSTILPHMVWP